MSTPKPSISSIPPILKQAGDTARLIGSSLDARELEALSRSCKTIQTFFRNTVIKKKKVSVLLSHIFNADSKKVKEFLSEESLFHSKPYKTSKPLLNVCLILKRSSCLEQFTKTPTYMDKIWNRIFSFNNKQTVLIRSWRNISPLEAAAWCGDIFILRELINNIPLSQFKIAIDQLQGILERKETEENGSFLAPYKALLKAYEEYHNKFNLFFEENHFKPIRDSWTEVGLCQKKLPIYALQEYCDERPFHPLPTFKEEPERSCYLRKGGTCLDLDAITEGWALYKGRALAGCWLDTFGSFCMYSHVDISHFDYAAISRLCEVRTNELCDIIKDLKARLKTSDLDASPSEVSHSEATEVSHSEGVRRADGAGIGL